MTQFSNNAKMQQPKYKMSLVKVCTISKSIKRHFTNAYSETARPTSVAKKATTILLNVHSRKKQLSKLSIGFSVLIILTSDSFEN